MGVELYEFFYKGYTQKQWGRPAEALDASVCRRIPIHTGLDERYFRDEFQALPKHGYHAMFEAMLEASKADLRLETDYREVLPQRAAPPPHLLRAPGRVLRLPIRAAALPDGPLRPRGAGRGPGPGWRLRPARPPGELPGARAVHADGGAEARHRPGRAAAPTWSASSRRSTSPARATPTTRSPARRATRSPPATASSRRAEPGVTFIGRLAQYRYLNMDQVVGAALHTFEKLRVLPA